MYSDEAKQLGDKIYSKRHNKTCCLEGPPEHNLLTVEEINALIHKSVSEGDIAKAQFHLSVLQYVMNEYIG